MEKHLTDDLLEYLLETKQESLHRGNFKVVCACCVAKRWLCPYHNL